jgi:hypothetical protein
VVLIETIGGLVSGYSRRGNSLKDMMPNATSIKLRTVAKTGRFTEISERIMI